MDIGVNTSPTESEINSILGEVWGRDSIIGKIHGLDTGETIAATIVVDDKPVGCAAFKILPWKELELGSVAILKSFRGQGLMKYLTGWRVQSIKKYLDSGYTLTTFATVGSDVMYSIHDSMEKICMHKCLPLNLGVGIVSIEKESAKNNLAPDVLIDYKNGQNLNSTIQISQIPSKVYGTLEVYPKVKELLSDTTIVEKKIKPTSNKIIKLPILMDLLIVGNTDWMQVREILNTYKDDRVLKVSVPMNNIYKEIISNLREGGAFMGGISLIDSFVYLDYMINTNSKSAHVVDYISKLTVEKFQHFGTFLKSVNYS